MPQVNDKLKESLSSLGFTGAIDDMLWAYLRSIP